MQAEEKQHQAWVAAMRCGDFERAWQISDVYLRERLAKGEPCWNWPRHLQPIWNGQPLARKRVLVRCYHGLGDTIQFIRFLRPLRQIARSAVLWVQPELLALARSAAGADEVRASHDGRPELDYDVDVEIMELAHALRIAAVPQDVPYLFVRRRAAASMCDRSLRVGLVWAAGDWDERRSLGLHDVRSLARVPGIEFFSLQRGPRSAESASIPAVDWGSDDVSETAARMLSLDLIISVDTMAAHLAGALGLPVWTLLQRDCDWRWPREGTETVWYPTMRLFHQERQGDWKSVIQHLRGALKRHARFSVGASARAGT